MSLFVWHEPPCVSGDDAKDRDRDPSDQVQ